MYEYRHSLLVRILLVVRAVLLRATICHGFCLVEGSAEKPFVQSLVEAYPPEIAILQWKRSVAQRRRNFLLQFLLLSLRKLAELRLLRDADLVETFLELRTRSVGE